MPRPPKNEPVRKKKKKKSKKYKKNTIPKALREQVWITNFGKKFQHKCHIEWCTNNISVFDFHVGHNIPEAEGGKLCLENLKPICARCNQSMGARYTITQWQKLNKNTQKRRFCCF